MTNAEKSAAIARACGKCRPIGRHRIAPVTLAVKPQINIPDYFSDLAACEAATKILMLKAMIICTFDGAGVWLNDNRCDINPNGFAVERTKPNWFANAESLAAAWANALVQTPKVQACVESETNDVK